MRAYQHTYGLPTLTTNCSNNYGPFQFPEKLIPLVILNALDGKPLPVYGDGLNVRDWLYVGDHCEAIALVLDRGVIGETYNIGGNSEMANIEVVTTICSIMDEVHRRGRSAQPPHHLRQGPSRPRPPLRHRCLQDRPRTGLAARAKPLPAESAIPSSGISPTPHGFEQVTSGEYRNWIAANYETRGAQ